MKVHADDDIVAQEDVLAVVAVEGGVDGDVLADGAEELLEEGTAACGVAVVRGGVGAGQLPGAGDFVQLLRPGRLQEVCLCVAHGGLLA